MTTKQAALEREHTEQYLAYQEIVEEIAANDPTVASEMSGALFCYFCGVWIVFEDHEDNCIWVRSRELVEKE